MKDEENDPLWKLLGRARPPEVSPFLARNVLREVRNHPRRERVGFVGWLSGRWRPAAVFGGVAALILVAVTVDTRSPNRANHANRASSVSVVRIAENPDYEVIADLDILLASESESLWLESSAAF